MIFGGKQYVRVLIYIYDLKRAPFPITQQKISNVCFTRFKIKIQKTTQLPQKLIEKWQSPFSPHYSAHGVEILVLLNRLHPYSVKQLLLVGFFPSCKSFATNCAIWERKTAIPKWAAALQHHFSTSHDGDWFSYQVEADTSRHYCTMKHPSNWYCKRNICCACPQNHDTSQGSIACHSA
jgi:hypothetical protein